MALGLCLGFALRSANMWNLWVAGPYYLYHLSELAQRLLLIQQLQQNCYQKV